MAAALREFVFSGRLHLYTCSELRSKECVAAAGLPFAFLPVPGIGADIGQDPEDRREEITIACLGEARATKRFEILPGIVAALNSRPAPLPFSWQIQCCRGEDHPEIARAERQLRELQALGLRIELHCGRLERPEYERLIRRSDVVLFLHDPVLHRHRPSARFLDALAARRIVVVPDGSWMRRLLPEDIPWCYSQPEEVPHILERIAGDLQACREIAGRLGTRLSRACSGTALVDQLLPAATGGHPGGG